MEGNTFVATVELTPIETISNYNSRTLFKEDIRLKNEKASEEGVRYPISQINEFSAPTEVMSPRNIVGGLNKYIDDGPFNKTKVNQKEDTSNVFIKDEHTEDVLSQKNHKNLPSFWDSERAWHEEIALARRQMFESMVKNKNIKFSWKTTAFYTFSIILASSSICIPYCLFPAHDIVKFPKYWYEILYHGSFFSFIDVAFFTVLAGVFLNVRHLKKFRTLSIICVLGIGATLLFYTSTYFIWTSVFSYIYPIPFFGYTCSFANRIFCCIAAWLAIPKGRRGNEGIRKRMKYFVAWVIATILTQSFYQILLLIVRIVRGQFQPLIALAFPVTKEISVRILMKLVKCCANGDERGAIIALQYVLFTNHTICLSYVIGSIADEATSWVLMLSDLLLGIYGSIVVARSQNRNLSDVTDWIPRLQKLAISKLVEIQAPIVFILVFALAYNTPVGSIVGNISNGYWAYEAVEDINYMLRKMAVFFLVDLISSIATTTILRFSCGLNFLKIIEELLKEFFGTFILYLAYINIGYLNVNLISFGVDHTLKFNWIHGKENFTNSVFGELS